jgi:hypothetical protein
VTDRDIHPDNGRVGEEEDDSEKKWKRIGQISSELYLVQGRVRWHGRGRLAMTICGLATIAGLIPDFK